jgi:hypothetical protein
MAGDDRVLPETRALGAFIVPFLLVAFPLLYFFPDDTGNWWAWEIRPSMTALIMGAGYIAGAYFFVQVARATRWHRVHLGFLPITAFTAFLGVATISYWDWFDHDHVAFWIWTALYFTTPFLVPLAWLRNRRADPGTLESAGDRYLERRVRSTLIAAGLVQFAIAGVLIASPSTMVDIWPWTLDSLAAASLATWFALPGVTALMTGIDGRWSAIRITLESQLIGLALILLATARSWEQFDKSNALTYVFAGGIALLLVGLAAALELHGAPDAPGARQQRRRGGAVTPRCSLYPDRAQRDAPVRRAAGQRAARLDTHAGEARRQRWSAAAGPANEAPGLRPSELRDALGVERVGPPTVPGLARPRQLNRRDGARRCRDARRVERAPVEARAGAHGGLLGRLGARRQAELHVERRRHERRDDVRAAQLLDLDAPRSGRRPVDLRERVPVSALQPDAPVVGADLAARRRDDRQGGLAARSARDADREPVGRRLDLGDVLGWGVVRSKVVEHEPVVGDVAAHLVVDRV